MGLFFQRPDKRTVEPHFLPTYSPEPNSDELVNADLKHSLPGSTEPASRPNSTPNSSPLPPSRSSPSCTRPSSACYRSPPPRAPGAPYEPRGSSTKRTAATEVRAGTMADFLTGQYRIIVLEDGHGQASALPVVADPVRDLETTNGPWQARVT
ncbi:hypothetical protein [Streptomyces sp. S1]|uniref:hypothetical protein n=1 Tax=Streptomyces sp. S1 TaxID=718288 RepID=UPI003D7400C2